MPTTVLIEGPPGEYRSAVAREVARRLGVAHLDTDRMYRAIVHLLLHVLGRTPQAEWVAVSVARKLTCDTVEDGVIVRFNGYELRDKDLFVPDIDRGTELVAGYTGVVVAVDAYRLEYARRHGAVIESQQEASVLPRAYGLSATPDPDARGPVVEIDPTGLTAEELAGEMVSFIENLAGLEFKPARPGQVA